ncbi:hypothetical protein [Nostoc sp. C057]|nr:hypothetical protein [Nostoc sp. C057]
MDKYRLLNCDFHDQLEALATLHQTSLILYRNAVEELETSKK